MEVHQLDCAPHLGGGMNESHEAPFHSWPHSGKKQRELSIAIKATDRYIPCQHLHTMPVGHVSHSICRPHAMLVGYAL